MAEQCRQISTTARPAKGRLARIIAAIHSDEGAAAIPFMIALPIFITIVGIFVQYALLINAKVMVQQAADLAARAAATSLPDEHPENVLKAARMSLAMLSPQSSQTNPEGSAVYEALVRSNADPVPPTFAQRYTYAMDATKVSWTHQNASFVDHKGQLIDVTVEYKFYLTVPGAMRLLSGPRSPAFQGTVGGVSGRFYTITATSQVQTSHGRKTGTDGAGWPG